MIPNEPKITPQLVAEHGLKPDEYQRLLDLIGRQPSFIEPYQGATTGVGGILRDVFTMGARPIACLDFLRFGDPAHPRTKELVAGVVAGIGGYGNSFGVPTVGGSVGFH